jgi:hypothetical protein
MPEGMGLSVGCMVGVAVKEGKDAEGVMERVTVAEFVGVGFGEDETVEDTVALPRPLGWN